MGPEQKTRMGGSPMAVATVLDEIKDALHELRHSAPESALVQIARQKIERLEQGLPRDRELGKADLSLRGLLIR